MAWLAGNPYDRAHTAYTVYGAPVDQIGAITTALRANASYLYVNDRTSDPWNAFGSTEAWDAFIKAMAA
jgi:hypothetical protein